MIDNVEELTTGCASTILVNSIFTRQIFTSSFRLLGSLYTPDVLYPTIEEDPEMGDIIETESSRPPALPLSLLPYSAGFDSIFLSLNRFERKKNIKLSIEALELLMNNLSSVDQSTSNESSQEIKQRAVNNNVVSSIGDDFLIVDNKGEIVDNSQSQRPVVPAPMSRVSSHTDQLSSSIRRILLVIAGGYDSRVDENKEHLQELMQACDERDIPYSYNGQLFPSKVDGSKLNSDHNYCHVEFRTSISNDERKQLLAVSTALLYTPDKEHFGIVPVESMYAGCPVIAVSSGGPLESVVHGVTGYLCPQVFRKRCNQMHVYIIIYMIYVLIVFVM